MLLRWENKMLCRMLGARMRPGVSWAEFQARRVNSARGTFHASGSKSLLTEALLRRLSLVRKSFWDYTKYEMHRRGMTHWPTPGMWQRLWADRSSVEARADF